MRSFFYLANSELSVSRSFSYARVRKFGHELLSKIIRFALILLSTLDPDAPAQQVPGLRPSIPGESTSRPTQMRMHLGRCRL